MAKNAYSTREENINALFTELAQNAKKEKMINPDRFSDIIKGIRFESPDARGVDTGNSNFYVEKARNCAYHPVFSEISYRNEFKIETLGTLQKQKAETAKKNPKVQSMLKMAHTLTATSEGAICLKAESCQTEQGMLCQTFSVASEKISSDAMLSMIRGCYGQVGASSVKKGTKKYAYNGYANIEMVLRNKQEIKRAAEEREFDSWVTTLLRSCTSNGNYAVEVQFIPMEDSAEKKQLDEHIKGLQELYSKLEFLSEIGWNENYAAGETMNSVGNFFSRIFQNVTEVFKGKDQVGMNISSAFSISSKQTDKEIRCLMEDLDYEIQRLQDAQNSKVWKVVIKASAEDEPTLDSITSTFSGVLEASEMSVTWTMKPTVAFVGSSKMIRPVIAFPVEDHVGFCFVENEEFSLVSPSSEKEGICIGNILWNGTAVSKFCLNADLLNRHAFICGMTGSGKTNTLFRLIEHAEVPFLAIEPVKGEYRSLGGHFKNLHIWTMRTSDKTDDHVQLLRINPFWFPSGGNLSFHIDSLKTLISSAFELSAAMPNILEQCLYNVYVHTGWNIVSNTNIYQGKLPEAYLYPTFETLANEVEKYLEQSDFGEEVLGNYKGALLSRLRSFTSGAKGVLFNTEKHPDYQILLSDRNVIELEGLAEDADKCLVMGTILIQYYQYLKLSFSDDGKKNKLRHILVLEEAHRLFKNQDKSQRSEGPNPTGQLVDTLSNIMAEIRAFGEGMLIVDQSPTKIAEDVIKNSGTKIIHRMDNEKDIKILQAAMLLHGNMTCFPSLMQGEAIVRTDGMQKPGKVKMSMSNLKECYSMSETFQSIGRTDDKVHIEYTAAAIMQNGEVVQEMTTVLRKLISSFAFQDWEDWKELINRFVLEIYVVLKNNGCADMLEGKFGVIEELISLTIKRMYSSSNAKQLGMVHMFIMRQIALYKEARRGTPMRRSTGSLLEHYYQAYLPASVLYEDYYKKQKNVEFQCLADCIADKNVHSCVLQELYTYQSVLKELFDEKPDLKETTGSCLALAYFHNTTLLEPDQYSLKYEALFDAVMTGEKEI